MADTSEIDAVKALLVGKPRPVGWDERRGRLDEIGAVWPVATDIALESADIGGVPAEWSIAPTSDASLVLLYFHGGGYCSGSIVSHRRLVTEAGRAAGMRTLAVGYRLAPEHPFPAAPDDAMAAWRFLLDQGIEPGHIVVGGDSAGGGLTLNLLTALRDAGSALPAGGWLISPWTDLTLSGDTLTSLDAVDPIIHEPYLAELVASYLPPSFDRRDPRVSPLFADLAGLPPLLVQVGADETLLADSVRLVEAAGIAQTAVTLEIWPHMIHAFPMWNAHLRAGREALASAGAFMQRQLRPR